MSRKKLLMVLGVVVLAAASPLAVTLAQAESNQENPTPSQIFFETPHFQCYSVSGAVHPGIDDDRVITDQFGSKEIDIDEPRRLCAPAQKDGTGEVDFRGDHLLCYDIDEGRTQDEVVVIVNQFTDEESIDEIRLTVRTAGEICLPSRKSRPFSD
jgi:hypothetical protein